MESKSFDGVDGGATPSVVLIIPRVSASPESVEVLREREFEVIPWPEVGSNERVGLTITLPRGFGQRNYEAIFERPHGAGHHQCTSVDLRFFTLRFTIH